MTWRRSAWLRAHEVISEPTVETVASNRLDSANVKLDVGDQQASAHKAPLKRVHSAEPETGDSDDSDIVVLSDLARPPAGFKVRRIYSYLSFEC